MPKGRPRFFEFFFKYEPSRNVFNKQKQQRINKTYLTISDIILFERIPK